MPPWCESILGLKVEAVQGKQVSLEWTEASGGLWEWWHDPRVALAFPVESTSPWHSPHRAAVLCLISALAAAAGPEVPLFEDVVCF